MLLISVAPLVGAWIEIFQHKENYRGRKVAPLVGAWIEIVAYGYIIVTCVRRSPRGSVD